jgi:hypothetical protein
MFHLDHATQTQDRDRRFTMQRELAIAYDFAKVTGFTLDVAAEALSHVCEDYFSPERGKNGLILPWYGHVWCNPPWSECGAWIRKAWAEWTKGGPESITMLLPVRTEQPFWQQLVEPYRDQPNSPLRVKFLEKRSKFGDPMDPEGKNAGSPPFICCLLHWRRP